MKRRYRISADARKDLRSIWNFIAEDNIPAADRTMARIEAACSHLARFPSTGHVRADVHTAEPVRFWPVGSYVVVYRAEPRPILIVRVIHGARDLDALL